MYMTCKNKIKLKNNGSQERTTFEHVSKDKRKELSVSVQYGVSGTSQWTVTKQYTESKENDVVSWSHLVESYHSYFIIDVIHVIMHINTCLWEALCISKFLHLFLQLHPLYVFFFFFFSSLFLFSSLFPFLPVILFPLTHHNVWYSCCSWLF